MTDLGFQCPLVADITNPTRYPLCVMLSNLLWKFEYSFITYLIFSFEIKVPSFIASFLWGNSLQGLQHFSLCLTWQRGGLRMILRTMCEAYAICRHLSNYMDFTDVSLTTADDQCTISDYQIQHWLLQYFSINFWKLQEKGVYTTATYWPTNLNFLLESGTRSKIKYLKVNLLWSEVIFGLLPSSGIFYFWQTPHLQ